MTETAAVERHEFQAEVRQVMDLMIHSLYSNKEIFLRELISNASDACDKLRFEALSDDSLYAGDTDLHVDIEVNPEHRTILIRDNGIGMSRDEVVENIGTIAHSGTRRFLDAMAGDKNFDAQLIGQFGVGFYSSFIVADKVTLLSRRAGSDTDSGVRWESEGAGEYSLESISRPQHGTEVIVHLKADEDEFLNEFNIRSIATRYSDHIGFPIRMPAAAAEESEPDAEPEEKQVWDTINSASALWTLPKNQISEEDYKSFYQQFAHDVDDPLLWSHNKVEGSQAYTSLLYIPTRAPLDLMLNRDERHGLKLYVKRVFIMDAAEALLPHYLRFVRGVVDSDDLPLNISRELLQENALVSKIRGALVKRTLKALEKLSRDDSESFLGFWAEFGPVLKEGMVEDFANRDAIAKLLRFPSTQTKPGELTSLADYIGRMKQDQNLIYYLTADSPAAAANSPHLEVFRTSDIEVLLLTDRVDEWMMGYFTEFDGKTFKSVAKGDIELGKLEDSKQREARESAEQDAKDLLERIQKVLADKVGSVRVSKRLTESPACLVLGDQDMALHMQRLLQQAGQTLPDINPDLELNVQHPLVSHMNELDDDSEFAAWSELLFDQALLAEGGQLSDPAEFVRRMNQLMLGLKGDEEE